MSLRRPPFPTSRAALATLLLAVAAAPVFAEDRVSLHGYVDLRLVAPPAETSWTKGGFGKTRYGDGTESLRFGGAALVASMQLSSELSTRATVQLQTSDHPTASVLEAYLRYRPVSTTPLRATLKLGVFFAPISYENDGVGWTSPWTITPSAINSWVGEELRTLGGEGRLEWRFAAGTAEAGASLYAANDPAGTLLQERGWSFSDLTYGLGDKLREPDATARGFGRSAPSRFGDFQEIDGRLGWYGFVGWRTPADSRITLLRYDNDADGSAKTATGNGDVYAWRTDFWSIAAQTTTGPVTWIVQGMDGYTQFRPLPDLDARTHFDAAYLLAGWNRGRWRPTLRADVFDTVGSYDEDGERATEHGYALTAALNWEARRWLRITAEALRVESRNGERAEYGLHPKAIDTQLQLSTRVQF